MQLRFHLDEDCEAASLIRTLRDRGFDLTTSTEAHLTTCTDEEQLTWAGRNGRVLITYNAADFCRLHKKFSEAGQVHAGIVIMEQQRLSVGERMRRLARLRATVEANAMRNRLEFLNNW